VTFPFIFAFRADLEAKAGGNPSWNTGVNYFSDLAKSADATEVKALYRSAGLSLGQDVRTLNHSQRISADPAAVAWLARNIAFDGDISVPVLTMHTTGDGLVVPENEQAYQAVVDRAGNGALLRQIFVARAGHCAFTPAETITAVQTLENRLSTGRWNVPAPAGPERRGDGARPAGQHLLAERDRLPDRAGLHQLHPGPLPAAVRPAVPAPARHPVKDHFLPNGRACLRKRHAGPLARSPRPHPSACTPEACTNGQISSAMQRQSAVADSSPSRANRPRLIRCRIT
jgi:hypothetical protein